MATNGLTKLRPIEDVVGLISGSTAKPSAAVELASVEKCQTPKDVVEYAKKRGLVMVDYKFTDLFGRWHHFSSPINHMDESIFEEGLGFDGSSIRAFQDIHESDMVLYPDPATAILDPILDVPTLSLTCNIYNPESLTPYNKDPRWVAIKAERYLTESKIADISYWGPEAEFFVFDGISFDYQQRGAHFAVETDLGPWEQGRAENDRWGSNLGYRPQAKGGYFRVPPVDKLQDWRSEAVLRMMAVGINVEAHHGEVASAQQEIDLRFSTLVNMGDQMHWYKYILKNVAASYGKTVTFMPKPMFEDNGNGMHCHQSLWKGDTNLFFEEGGYANLSQMARWYIGGIIKHTPALLAIVAPTTNSYKRLVPGFEAPVMMAYSNRNRSACIRIPAYSESPKAKRIEYRCPDPSGNPYLTFSALLMAGLDGIINKIEPGDPMDVDLYEAHDLSVQQVPGSLDAVLRCLADDHDFLLRGDVFTQDLIDTWIDWKTKNEVDAIRIRTHPYEYVMYYDI